MKFITTLRQKNRLTAKEYFQDENKILPCLYDPIFKELFGNEDHPEIVASLMSILLDIPYEKICNHIHFLQKSMKKARFIDKNGEKDVIFKISIKPPVKILLEANFHDSKDDTIILRNFYWLANVFGSGLKKAKSYDDIETAIQYNFNLFFMDSKKKRIINQYDVSETSDRNSLLESRKFEIYHFNIAEMKRVWYNGDIQKYDERTRQIILFCALMLIDDKKDFKKCLQELNIQKSVKKEIERIVVRMNDNQEIYYEFFDRKTDEDMLRRGRIQRAEREAEKRGMERGMERGMKRGMERGYEEGHTKAMMSVLRNMKQSGMKIPEISKVTLIPESQIQKLLR